MLSAQYFHFKVNNPWLKRLSLIIYAAKSFIAAVTLNLIALLLEILIIFPVSF
jgi:hypothetical protein